MNYSLLIHCKIENIICKKMKIGIIRTEKELLKLFVQAWPVQAKK